MNKSRLWSQNSLRQTGNVFVFSFSKHLFNRRNVLHIGRLVEKVINPIVLIRTIKFNLKQVKQKPLEFCTSWKFFWNFTSSQATKTSMLLVILFTINSFIQYYVVLSSQKRYFIENYLSWSCLILNTTTPQQPSLDGHSRVLYKLK